MAADAAIAEALKVGEVTRLRLEAEEQGAANGSEDADDPMQGTPPKQRKKR